LFTDEGTEAIRLRGTTTAIENDVGWSVGYDYDIDPKWNVRRVRVAGSDPRGDRERVIERMSPGRWTIDGAPAAHLDGCIDVDLESSAVTNAIPVHRIPFEQGQTIDAPAVFVTAGDLAVLRLEQQYTLRSRPDVPEEIAFDYYSPTFDFHCELHYDASGLVVDYPGIARRNS